MFPKLLLATGNAHKLEEFKSFLGDMAAEYVTLKDLSLPEPDETGTTYIENARLKAVAAMQASGLPALADDSGFAVEALEGAPGIYSARWAGSNKDFSVAMKRVHDEMGHEVNRGAAFICALVLALPDGKLIEVQERATGEITWPPRGEHGFGYDPMFIPQGYTQSFAEIPAEVKNKISHRALAFRALKEKL
ncbi:MAG: RdgB/HAM1 family non-canonical purine NTP pyrophosphatase [Alphaproteobacteria bacterium]|nr:RdgB/HAM1 family non-canonical purine NTP pyrophosphatase [Alphaproteobacteria bacterium]